MTNILLQSQQKVFEKEFVYNYVLPLGVAVIMVFVLFRLFKSIQTIYASIKRKPIFNHVYLKRNKLTDTQRSILIKEHLFFRKLSDKHQLYFEHRVAVFINTNEFIGRQELVITERMKVSIAATATMLTFGFKKYTLDIIETVIIYPQAYYSEINNTYHKGETNPQMKAIVFSWEDYEQGYKIGDDNLNLGIHEFGHAIHLNASDNNDVSSFIFNKGYKDLTNYLQNHEAVRQKLIASRYFREYAYTNQFEFFAVLLENFIETPSQFKAQFPELYKYMKQMLNFKFAGY